MTLRRVLILALLPTAVKLVLWALFRKAIRDLLTKNDVLISKAKKMRASGYSEAETAKTLGMSTTTLRSLFYEILSDEREERIKYARWMKDQGDSNAMIAERLGITESHIRVLLA